MKRIFLIAIILFSILLLVGIILLNWNADFIEEPRDNISTQAEFDSKIVYTTDTTIPPEQFQLHCKSLGGEFNECGTPCAPDADVCAQVCAFTCENIISDDVTNFDTSNWNTFSNSEYSFSLRYDADDWNTATETSFDFSPKYNIYQKPQGTPLTFPITHHSNVTNVSIFPLGIPTEGVFGKTIPFQEEIGFAVSDDSRIYILEDGTPFAAFIRPREVPTSWNEAGFLWIRVWIENLETRCLRDGVQLTEEECDPLGSNDTIVRTGVVDASLWEEELTMIRTFSFDNSTTGIATGTDMVLINSPLPNEVISSPVTVRGEACGTWYFEGSFSVVLTDWEGRIVAQEQAQAEGEWMTENFIPYSVELTFDSPYSEGDLEFMKNGTLILQKANPSGLSEHAETFEVPIRFSGNE